MEKLTDVHAVKLLLDDFAIVISSFFNILGPSLGIDNLALCIKAKLNIGRED